MDQEMEKQAARNWYWWLWLSPLITFPSLVILAICVALAFTEPGYELICRGNWRHCDYDIVYRVDFLIAVLGSALWHLILLIPALNGKSGFVRWHGRQALFLAGVRTAVPLAFGLAFGFDCETLLFIPVLIVVWFFGTLWGQMQAIRGNCSLMRWFGRAEALPRPEPAEEPTQVAKPAPAAELDPEALVEIFCHSSDPKERRQALAELEKRGMVDSL